MWFICGVKNQDGNPILTIALELPNGRSPNTLCRGYIIEAGCVPKFFKRHNSFKLVNGQQLAGLMEVGGYIRRKLCSVIQKVVCPNLYRHLILHASQGSSPGSSAAVCSADGPFVALYRQLIIHPPQGSSPAAPEGSIGSAAPLRKGRGCRRDTSWRFFL